MAKKNPITRSSFKIPGTTASNTNFVVGTNYLLAIAIDNYPHINKLYNCKRDAEKIVELLTSKYTFSPDNVTKLYDEDATAKNILLALDKYAAHLEEHDSLMFLFSGHGKNHRDIGFWIPVEAKDFPDFIPLSTIRDFLEPIKARHIFLVSDSCFSGKLFTVMRDANSNPLEGKPSRFALTAGRDEPVLDGTLGDHSPFARAFLNVLEETIKDMGSQELSLKVQMAFEGAQKGQRPLSAPLNIARKGETLELAKTGQFYFKLKNDTEATEHIQIGKRLMDAAKEVPDPGIYHAAAKHLERAKTKPEPDPEIPYLLGKAYQGAGDYEKAMKAYEEFIRHNQQYLPPKNER